MNKLVEIVLILLALNLFFVNTVQAKQECTEWFEPNFDLINLRLDAKRTSANIKKSGWVDISFSVDKGGRVIDIEVMESSSEGIFDAPFVEALKKWRFRPLVVEGYAKTQTCLRFTETFKAQ
jgi:TonB family protein